MPPMGVAPEQGPMDGGMSDQMGVDEPPMNTDGNEGGVGSDVKKYSGELSQALNTYNEENPTDDEKINKYAINMIAAQVADSLTDKDKRSVIKKLKGNSEDMSDDELQEPMGDEEQSQMAMENRLVKEISDEILNGRKPVKRDKKYISNDKISKNSPFVCNR